jgi:hypothetical protein
MSQVLFILKRREDYNAEKHSAIGMSTGLYNSAKFMHDMLLQNGIQSNLEVVADYNRIDRQVWLYTPSHVILEAIWVTPQKLTELQRLHPNVKWVVRIHSEMPFLAGEGRALDWIADYTGCKNVIIGVNAPRMLKEMEIFLKLRNNWTAEQVAKHVVYLPNYYPQQYTTKTFDHDQQHIDVGCFGAIRPLKNHLLQAFAAIGFAESIGKKLRFHVNAGRIEMQGAPAISNLKSVFQQLHATGHELINHQWRPREEFLELCAQMDIGMQCNFSETFNIVGADLISQGVPLIGTKEEIPWAVHELCADPNDGQDIMQKMAMAYADPQHNVASNQHSLTRYTDKTEKIWVEYFQ